MNQIAIILYSNPKDPTKSVIPNNKKIVLECDKLEILEDIMHKLQSLLTDGEQGIPILYVKKEMLTPLGDGMYSYRLKYSSEVTNDGIYKALVKMVLDLVPKSELDHFRNIIVWINGNQIDPILPSAYYAIRSEGEKYYMQPRLDLFFNTQQNFSDSPYCTAILYTTDVQYIFVVPFVDIDMGQFKYNDQLIGHWKRMFEMLHQREWIEQNTSDTHPAYTWLRGRK